MIRPTPFLCLTAAAWLVGASALQATPINISEAGGYNLVVFGNASLTNSDTEGRVAIGGNATFNNYSIGLQAPVSPATTAEFVVGGSLTAGNGQVYNGSVYVGGTFSGPGYNLNSAAGSVTQANLGATVPFNFSLAQTALTSKSLTFGAEAATGTSVLQYSTLTLTGTNSAVNVFNITAAQLASASTLQLSNVGSSIVLINVSGTTATFSNMGLSGFTASNVLFNFYQATSLSLSGIGVEGSILAPFASVAFTSGQLNGQLIANSLSGAQYSEGELHNYLFNNQPNTSVPDSTGTGALMLIGLCGLVFVGRRVAGTALA